MNLGAKQLCLPFRFRAYWQGNVGELPEANRLYVCHMRKKTLEDLSFRTAFGATFGHLGIGLQSLGRISFFSLWKCRYMIRLSYLQ